MPSSPGYALPRFCRIVVQSYYIWCGFLQDHTIFGVEPHQIYKPSPQDQQIYEGQGSFELVDPGGQK